MTIACEIGGLEQYDTEITIKISYFLRVIIDSIRKIHV